MPKPLLIAGEARDTDTERRRQGVAERACSSNGRHSPGGSCRTQEEHVRGGHRGYIEVSGTMGLALRDEGQAIRPASDLLEVRVTHNWRRRTALGMAMSLIPFLGEIVGEWLLEPYWRVAVRCRDSHTVVWRSQRFGEANEPKDLVQSLDKDLKSFNVQSFFDKYEIHPKKLGLLISSKSGISSPAHHGQDADDE